MVLNILDLPGRAALGMVNYGMYEYIGKDSLETLRNPLYRDENLKFLFRLWEWFPGRSLCTECATYHSDTSLAADYIRAKTADWSDERFDLEFDLCDGYSLSWREIFELKEEVNRRGTAINVSRLKFDWLYEHTDPYDQGPGWAFAAKMGIDNIDHLLMCVRFRRPLTANILQNPRALNIPYL